MLGHLSIRPSWAIAKREEQIAKWNTLNSIFTLVKSFFFNMRSFSFCWHTVRQNKIGTMQNSKIHTFLADTQHSVRIIVYIRKWKKCKLPNFSILVYTHRIKPSSCSIFHEFIVKIDNTNNLTLKFFSWFVEHWISFSVFLRSGFWTCANLLLRYLFCPVHLYLCPYAQSTLFFTNVGSKLPSLQILVLCTFLEWFWFFKFLCFHIYFIASLLISIKSMLRF